MVNQSGKREGGTTLIVIPAHNEEDSISEVVGGALHHADVLVTDDGSTDRTGDLLRQIQSECENGRHRHRLSVVTHEKATHIPQALQDGLRVGLEGPYRFFITMDAGLSHDPQALPHFMETDPSIDVVIGRREESANVPLYRRLISRLAAVVVNYSLTHSYLKFRGPRLRDCTSGFRRYSRRAALLIAEQELKSRSFDFHMEALAIALRADMKATEIPITYVFSNSSFNGRVLAQAMKFGFYLLFTKRRRGAPVPIIRKS